jgi:hypothetical protein
MDARYWKTQRPGGGYRLATWMRDNGWDVEVCEWIQWWSLEELKEFARSRITKDTMFCGFSCFFGAWSDTIELFTQWLKETYPNVILLSGSQSRPNFNTKWIDYYFIGWSEYAILDLAKHVSNNSSGNGVKLDSNFFGTGKKVINANTFYQAWPIKSLKIIYEDRDYLTEEEWVTIEFARGCKFNCSFCNFPALGIKEDTTRDREDYLYQLRDTYDRFGVKNYYVADETFNDTTEKIIKFADATEELNFQPLFSGFIRADLMVSRPQDLEHLSRLGMLGHFYGIETFFHETGKAIGKGMHPDRLKQGLIDCKNYFKNNGRKIYRGTISLIVGLPHEPVSSIYETLEWCANNWRGENIEIWPLEIPTDYKHDKLSKISIDWEKYGYKEVQKEFAYSEDSLPSDLFTSSYLNWQNDHMTYDQACEICFKAHNEYRGITLNEGFGNWSMDIPYKHFNKDYNLMMNTVEHDFKKFHLNNYENYQDDKIRDYIIKKLNWNKK